MPSPSSFLGSGQIDGKGWTDKGMSENIHIGDLLLCCMHLACMIEQQGQREMPETYIPLLSAFECRAGEPVFIHALVGKGLTNVLTGQVNQQRPVEGHGSLKM